MTYDERKRIATEALVDFLDEFTPPRGMDDDKLSRRIAHIADAFARYISKKGDFREKVAAVMLKVRDSHETNTWPPQSVFVEHMPRHEAMSAPLQSFELEDRAETYAQRMQEGDAVPESVIWGNLSSMMPHSVLEGYRRASVANAQKVYRSDAYAIMRKKHGEQVQRYFPRRAGD